MSKKTELEESLKNAMRSQDELVKRTLRMVLASIRMAEVEKKGQPVDDAAVLAILQKEVKSRQEAIGEAQTANRPDLEKAARDEIGILEGFLPKQLTPEELEGMAREAIAEAGATSQRDMGRVMKVLLPRTQGRAGGDQVSQVVRKLLA
jgi:uncharacterized protein YqeY